MLTAALRISSSSLYAAFGTKADLFNEAVRTYALRYSAIYDRAVAEPTVERVIDRVLRDSVDEFSRSNEGHPGCLTSSAVMADTSATLDVRTYVADLQRSDEARLRARIERAAMDGDPAVTTNPAVLTELVQTLWQGLSARSELGATREDLLSVTALALSLINQTSRTPGLENTVLHS